MKETGSTKDFERAIAATSGTVKLRLYIAGSSDRSTRAIKNAKEICDEHFAGRYELDVIDIYKQPKLAKEDHILAVPTLVKSAPPPPRRFVGDLSNRALIVRGLELAAK
jgi:circadian clock protein KaiB